MQTGTKVSCFPWSKAQSYESTHIQSMVFLSQPTAGCILIAVSFTHIFRK